jgi:hypothetical protein
MSTAKQICTLLLLAFMLLPAYGCGRKSAPLVTMQQREFREIHELYFHFVKSQERPPKVLSDLTKEDYEKLYPMTVKDLQDGKYLVVWGVDSKDAGTVLAYEKDAPDMGGAVLMANGTVKTMTADQFKAAKQ